MSNIGHISADIKTDTGLVRDHNEDFVDSRKPETHEEELANGWLYIVADGVGGADAGEVASQYATERTVFHYIQSSDQTDWGQRILDAMQAANTDLRQFVLERNNNSRMATTMVTAVIQDSHLFIGNVGDSRGYLWRQGIFQQITKDQSLVAKLLEEGAITAEEARNHPRKNVILYSLGSENQPKIDLFELSWEVGDILLLCSDGLTKHVEDDEMAEIITSAPPEKATDMLIALANERGGEDNISVAIVRYETKETKQKARKKAAAAASLIPTEYRPLMWFFTFGLSIIQSILIILVWFFLRV